MIENDLKCLEETLLYVDHFVQIGSGIIDTLAIDSEGNPVVIEYKVEEGADETALLQTLSYASWVDKNPDSMLRFIREKKPEVKVESLGDVRIIIVTPTFTERTKQAAEMVEPDILLKRYIAFELPSIGKKLYLETIYDSRARRPKSGPTAYSIDYHFEGSYAKMKPIFEQLVSEAEKLGDDVKIEPKKFYIAFRRAYNFAVINVYTSKLEVGFPVPSTEPDTRMIDISKWGFSRILYGIILKDKNDIDERLLKWLKASYEAS
jgi:predicted transport protein